MSRTSSVFLFILPALIFIGHVTAQNSGWGSGIIIPEKGIQTMHINMPLASFGLFDTPGGKKAGTIFMKNSVNVVYSLEQKMIVCRVKDEDLAEVAAAGWCLKYYGEQGDFVKILVQSTGIGLWISKTELNYLHLKPETWLDFMLAKKTGFYPNIDIGLNLRLEPDAGSKKIVLMKGDHYLIDLDGETDGAWAKATVKKYSTRPCKAASSDNLSAQETLHGWIKIVDDKGFPNIWFYPRGCE
ncbi:MAG: hypothetical protein WCM76_01240 [Bacteroidota bacterium]